MSGNWKEQGVSVKHVGEMPGPDDISIRTIAYGFMASQALFAALELSLFDVLDGGPLSLQSLAGRLPKPVAPLRLRTLLTSLVAMKALRISDQLYSLSPNTARHLVQGKDTYYGDFLRFQVGRLFYPQMGSLADILVTGNAPTYAGWFSDPRVVRSYTQAQHNGAKGNGQHLLAQLKDFDLKLDKPAKLLDVGGGSGGVSYAFSGAFPQLQCTVMEFPEVCALGEEYQAAEGLCKRVKFLPFDATNPDWPVQEQSFDVVLMSYLCGSVPMSVIPAILRNAFRALRPGGLFLIHDYMAKDALDGPMYAALWALAHLTINVDGVGLTPAAVTEWVQKTGFVTRDVRPVLRDLTQLVIAQKPAGSRL